MGQFSKFFLAFWILNGQQVLLYYSMSSFCFFVSISHKNMGNKKDAFILFRLTKYLHKTLTWIKTTAQNNEWLDDMEKLENNGILIEKTKYAVEHYDHWIKTEWRFVNMLSVMRKHIEA